MPARLFWFILAVITAGYLVFWLMLIGSTATYATPGLWVQTVVRPEIRYAIWLSLTSSTTAAAVAVAIAIPIGYLMARCRFPGRTLVDAFLDIPIVLPPMVVGLCLLIFFQTPVGRSIEAVLPFTYTVAGVILAQVVVAAAFAIRSLRGTFDHLSPRPEEVALTLGATRLQALWHVALPGARRGLITAFCLGWARSLGEFGPILVFVGSTRFRTEVLPTTVWIELSSGNLEAAVSVSLLMILIAVAVLIAIRTAGEKV